MLVFGELRFECALLLVYVVYLLTHMPEPGSQHALCVDRLGDPVLELDVTLSRLAQSQREAVADAAKKLMGGLGL